MLIPNSIDAEVWTFAFVLSADKRTIDTLVLEFGRARHFRCEYSSAPCSLAKKVAISFSLLKSLSSRFMSWCIVTAPFPSFLVSPTFANPERTVRCVSPNTSNGKGQRTIAQHTVTSKEGSKGFDKPV